MYLMSSKKWVISNKVLVFIAFSTNTLSDSVHFYKHHQYYLTYM